MAATEVIRFHFRAQAFYLLHPPTLRQSHLFERSPPVLSYRQQLSLFNSPVHSIGIPVSRNLANRSTGRPDGGRKGRFECKRLMCTKQFYW